MNKVVNVNIGGLPFIMNEDAHAYLSNYLDALKAHFSNEEGTEEILGDIENRLAELFTESLGARKIVELSDIQSAINIIGKPEEFEENTTGQSSHEHEKHSNQKSDSQQPPPFNFKIGKRLYKNPDDKIVSGVASGLAAYFGIKEPVIIRLAFVFLAIFGGGSGIPIYIVLMLILKEAKTPKEKLEMRGEPINLESLTKVVHEEVNKFGETIKDFSDKSGFTDKFTSSKSKKNSNSSRTQTVKDEANFTNETPTSGTWDPNDLVEQAKEVTRRFGQSFEFALRGLLKILSTFFKTVGGVVLAALFVAWIAVIVSLIKGAPAIMMFMPSYQAIANLGFLNIIFIILIPIIGFAILILRLVFGRKTPSIVTGVLAGLWFLNLGSFSIVGSKMAEEFKTPYTVIENLLTNPAEMSSLHFKAIRNQKDGIHLGSLSYWNDRMNLASTTFIVEKSTDDLIHLMQHKSSKGKTEESAMRSAMELQHEIVVNGDTVSIMDRPFLKNPSKFRAQSTEVVLRIPEGKTVSFDKSLGSLRFQSLLPGDQLYNMNLRGKFLTLIEGNLKITDEFPTKEKQSEL